MPYCVAWRVPTMGRLGILQQDANRAIATRCREAAQAFQHIGGVEQAHHCLGQIVAEIGEQHAVGGEMSGLRGSEVQFALVKLQRPVRDHFVNTRRTPM